jgi:pterin-4a-carbinolamine dehydratase
MNTQNEQVQQEDIMQVNDAVAEKKRLPPADDTQGVVSRLKSERVQLALQRLRGWQGTADPSTIARVRKFGDHQTAAAYAAYLAHHALAARQPVALLLQGKRVRLEIRGHQVRGEGQLSGRAIRFAQEVA